MLAVACDGTPVGRERARSYFNEHRAAFDQVVAQAELCQPETGRLDGIGDIRCTSPEGNAENLADAMKTARAQWIRAFYTGDDASRSLHRVHIAVHAYGMAYAGVIEEFIYEATPAIHAEFEREDDGIAVVERQPVTGPPHHWYWRRIDR